MKKVIFITSGRAGNGKSTLSLEKDIKAFLEADRNPGTMQIRKCGNGWVCCTGDCGNCLVPRMTTSNRTEPNHDQTHTTFTRIEE